VDWVGCRLADIAAPLKNALVGGPFGSDLVSSDYVASGVPVIRGENLSHGRWVSGDFVFVSEPKAATLAANTAGAWDLVFTQRGANHYRQVALVPPSVKRRMLISQSQMKLTPNTSIVDPLFIYYVFRAPDQQEYLRRNAIQTGVPHTNLGILRSVPLRLPPLYEQRRVAEILGALDDKIELNRRMNETLEAIARETFRALIVRSAGRGWFLNPVADATPAGWSILTAHDVVHVLGGSTPSTNEPTYWGEDIPFVTPRDLSQLSSPVLLQTERSITDAGAAQISSGVLPKGTLLLSSRAPIGYLAIAEMPICVNQGFVGMVCDQGVGAHYMLQWCRESMDRIMGAANGTTFLEISKGSFKRLTVPIAPIELRDRYESTAEILHRRIVLNERESRTLAELRDTLLPKLLSGELRVHDTEKVVAAQL
jgi:type I restriction enzyme S subunit